MTKRDIQARAKNLLDRFEAETGVLTSTDAAGPHAVLSDLCQWLGLRLFEDPLLEDGEFGELNRAFSKISYRKNLGPERERFTIAHELGHFELHPEHEEDEDESTINDAVEISEHDAAVFRSYDPRSRRELEANRFAAALLVPMHDLKRRLQIDEGWSVESLCSYFGVSRRAMVSQLCGLLTNGERAKAEAPTEKPALDGFQFEAVRVDAPALVVAGPGAGKTRILVERFAWLVNEKEIAPERILALTFANKAATEMVERLSAILPDKSSGLCVSTFHSFGMEVLKGFGDNLPQGMPPRMVTVPEAFALVKRHLRELPLGSFEDLRQPTMHLKVLLETISRAKDELVGPHKFRELAQAELTALEATQTATPEQLTKARKSLEAADFYFAYERLMEAHGCADFGDLIARTVKLLRIPEVAESIRRHYDHILVDETQDINYATSQMLSLLDGGRGVIWAVGDPRQSIYRFRGASSVSLVNFAATYKDSTTKELLKNYRSVPGIVSFGQTFEIPRRVAGDDLPVPKLTSGRVENADSQAVEVVSAADEHSELCHVATEIKKFQEGGVCLEDVAVLCRTRAQAQKVSDTLTSLNVPNTWAGPLDARPAFKDLIGALYLATDDLRGLVRLWDGDASDLRVLFRWAAGETKSLSHVLHEAKERQIEGLSEGGVSRCSQMWSVSSALRKLPSATSVLERFAFDYSREFRAMLLEEGPAAYRTKSTVAEVVSLSCAYEASVRQEERGASAFLAFVRAAIEAGELKETSSEAPPKAVTVLTIHRSKGLEWPIVFLPFIADKKMPPGRKRTDDRPIPQGLVHGEDPNDPAIESACLFYVAATRARERLILSYSAQYGPKSPSGPSPYIVQILNDLDKSQKVTSTNAVTIARPAAASAASGLPFVFKGPIPYSALASYDDCPRQFEHRYVFNLSDDETGYRDFHSALYATQQWSLDSQPGDVPPSQEELLARYDAEWSARQPDGHWYDSKYRAHAHRILTEFRTRWLKGRPTIDFTHATLHIGGSDISIPVNEVVRDEDGETVIVRHHFGRPASTHLKDDRQALLVLFGRQNVHPSTKSAFRYMAAEKLVHTPFTDRVIKNAIERTENKVSAISSGLYPARPDAFRCRSCASNLICSSTTEEDE